MLLVSTQRTNVENDQPAADAEGFLTHAARTLRQGSFGTYSTVTECSIPAAEIPLLPFGFFPAHPNCSLLTA